ncbi:MAG: DUF2442 domain-containing protein [Chloroflexota bacterium]
MPHICLTCVTKPESRYCLVIYATSGISVPLIWFPLLHEAAPEQREKYEIGGGVSLHWPEIDEDLSIASLLAGGDLQSA